MQRPRYPEIVANLTIRPRTRLPPPRGGMGFDGEYEELMSTARANLNQTDPAEAKSNFEIYRSGSTTREIRLIVNLVLVARRWRALLDDRLRVTGQSSARMEAMAAIINSPPLSPQVDIAKRLRIEGPTMTRMLDTLEKDGLVERLADPGDRRTKQLRLTRDGESVLEDIFAITDDLRDRLLDGIPVEQMDAMNSLLVSLIGRLDSGLMPRPQND